MPDWTKTNFDELHATRERDVVACLARTTLERDP
jgi:hypothetical protein